MAPKIDSQSTSSSVDDQARRLASLIMAFSNAQTAIPSSRIHASYYSELSDDSFRRKFQRDRITLALCGFSITAQNSLDGEKLWVVDEERTFADISTLTHEEALLIAVACAPLTRDTSFAYREELIHALAKLYRSFVSTTVVKVHNLSTAHTQLHTLVSALSTGYAVLAEYMDVKGTKSKRRLALYGSFGLREHTYFVAANLDKPEEEPHVYRLDRFSKVTLTKESYTIPYDFDIQDYIKLPFQLGDSICTARFKLPSNQSGAPFIDKGQLHKDNTWTCDVADLKRAAAWAIAEGLIPLEPQELKDHYLSLLQEASHVR